MSRVSICFRKPVAEACFHSKFFRFDWEFGESYYMLETESGEELEGRFESLMEAKEWAEEKGFSIVGE